jgi:hypothetical protein
MHEQPEHRQLPDFFELGREAEPSSGHMTIRWVAEEQEMTQALTSKGVTARVAAPEGATAQVLVSGGATVHMLEWGVSMVQKQQIEWGRYCRYGGSYRFAHPEELPAYINKLLRLCIARIEMLTEKRASNDTNCVVRTRASATA